MEYLLQKAFVAAIVGSVFLGGCTPMHHPIYNTDTKPATDLTATALQKPPVPLKKKSRVELPANVFQDQQRMMMRYYQTMPR